MEEEKKSNKKVFYLVLGIVLSVGLTIGGTYAYFSASKTATGTQISGTTNDISGLSITTARVNLSPSPAPASDNLVPADFGVTPNNMTTTDVNRALTNKCVNNGYTGCHVWKITASSNQTIPSANIELSLSLIDVEDKDDWAYIVYEGTDTSSSNIVHKGNIITDFPNGASLDIHSGGSITGGTPKIYYVMVYLNNVNSAQNDGVTTGTTDARGTYNGTATLKAMGGEVKASFLDTAAEYITNLYTNASKSTATVNSITYNLAPSVNLMNDRLASSSVGADSGNIRYYGADPNNYVWLGDTFTSDYTYNSNGSSITRAANSKKLWRIIGVFDGRVKLVTADPISTQGLSWDTSANTTGGNRGYGINQWGPSGSYEGADLMRLLNPGYESDSINNSLYWAKETGTVYTGQSNATTANISFANTGLSQSEKDKIDTAIWYLGAFNGDASYANVHYASERQSETLGKICSSGNYCNDTVERTSTWNGKVGLMYPSDYGYGTDLSTCTKTLSNYSNSSNSYACRANDWLFNSSYLQLTIGPRADSSSGAYRVFIVYNDGSLGNGVAADGYRVRPAVYLKPGVTISGGNGTEEEPYILN